MATSRPFARKPLVSSILLWMRNDRPRQQGMDYWKGPHSKIISATPGMEEYRQIHLAEDNPGLWPATSGVETVIPAERRIDGVAEVTFTSVLSPLRGRKQTRLAYKDEVNVFRRTLLYAGLPTRPAGMTWPDPGRRLEREASSTSAGGKASRPGRFEGSSRTTLFPLSPRQGSLRELRTQVFMPWIKQLWDTPTSRTTTRRTSGSTPH